MKIVIDNVFWWKVSFIFIVFFEAFLSGLIPTWSKSCRENPKILGNANAFAAGVFLAIAFVHILPEMAGNWNELMATKGVDKPFPLPYFLLFLGYTLILIIDKVMFDTHSIFEGDSHKHDDNVDPAEIKLVNNVRASMVQLQAVQKSEVPSMLKRSQSAAQIGISQAIQDYLNPADRLAVRIKSSMNEYYSNRTTQKQDLLDQQSYLFVEKPVLNNSNKLTFQEEEFRNVTGESEKVKKQCCNMKPFIFLIALSVHACFEGIALGLSANLQITLSIMLAIFLHKGAASSALGISLVKAFPKDFTTVRWLMLTFSIATPLGIAIGILASGAGEIIDVIFSSLAAGTFVYIGCTEIIVQEFSVPGHLWLKLFFFLFGAATIICLSFIPGA